MKAHRVFSPQKAIYGFMILGLVLSLFHMGRTPVVRAQGSGLEAAILAAIKEHRANSTDEYYYNLLNVVEYGEWGIGQAERIWKDTNEVIPDDFSRILGQKNADGSWRVVLPNDAEAYLDLLANFPGALLENTTKEQIRTAYSIAAPALYSGHYLPWTKDSAAIVYQNYTTHGGAGQLDFGFPGNIRTSKAGTLVFAYDAHTWSECTGQSSCPQYAWYYNNVVVIQHAADEYSSYMHLQTDSIPAGIINNCNNGYGGSCTPVYIPAGSIIGTVGSIGYSTIAHLHFGTGYDDYGSCTYPDVYDEDGDGNTTETNICTGGIIGGKGVPTDFYEKPYDAPNCGTGEGQDPTLCMRYYPKNTPLVSQNPDGLFRDEFNSTALDPRWHWINEAPTHWSLTSSPGWLQIITQPKDIWQSYNNAPLLLQSLEPSLGGNFEIQTRIVIAPTADYHQGGLVIFQDLDNYVRFTYAYINGLTFEFAQEVNGIFQPIQVPAPPGINDFHLRIAKLGSNYYAYYSQDNTNWTLAGTQPNVNLSPLEVGLLAFNAVDVTTIEIPADFDYFQVKPAAPVNISGDAGTGEVTLSYMDGILKTATSASDGTYSLSVPHGWSGTVTPSKTGYTFDPPGRSYTNVVSDQISQDYTAITSLKAISKASQDGWLLESGEDSNQGGTINPASSSLFIGDDAEDRQHRSILSFNTSGLPDTAVITAVTLKMARAGVTGNNPFASLGNLLVDVRKGSFSGDPALQPGDFQSPACKGAAMNITNNPVNGWYSKAMGSAGFACINKAGLTQFRLRFAKDDDDDLVADQLRLYSGNALTASLRPQLIIKYYVP